MSLRTLVFSIPYTTQVASKTLASKTLEKSVIGQRRESHCKASWRIALTGLPCAVAHLSGLDSGARV